MPHAQMKLIAGIDTTKTPALNQAAFSESQLIRFIPDQQGAGLVQKMGGWINYAPGNYFPNTKELRPWEDLSGVSRLAIGTTTTLETLLGTTKANTDITPEKTSSASSPLTQTATISVASPAVITVATAPVENAPIVFSTTGALPTGMTAGTVYYVTNATATTFNIATSVGGSLVTTTVAGSGVHTATIAMFSTTSGTNTVTVTDTNLNVQTATFSNGSPTIVTVAISPASGTSIVFAGPNLPTGVTAGTTYYVLPINATTFNISTSAGGSAVNTSSTGTGNLYVPNSLQNNFSVYFKTPISIANFLISGVYSVTKASDAYFNKYTISMPLLANATTSVAVLPTFTVSTGYSNVVVTEPNHPYYAGANVAFLYPTTSAGITIYGNYTLDPTYSISSTQYGIFANNSASSSSTFSMNGGSVFSEYYFNLPSTSVAAGYGGGTYGSGGYGIGTSNQLVYANPITSTDWIITNFGELLIACPQQTPTSTDLNTGGPIYYWSPSSNTATAYLLNTAPMANAGVFVAMPQRQLVAYGSTVTGIQDNLLVRWSDVGDITVWNPTAANQAGSYRIPEGSQIIGAIQGPQQALIWTDLAVWSMQYVGPPFVYGFNKIGDGVGAISKKCMGSIGGVIYWMSPNKFCSLAGSGVQAVNCPVWDVIYQDLNTSLTSIIRCATNSTFGEITWFYPSNNNASTGLPSTYNDRYVKYNVVLNAWDYGILDRTAWTDQSVLGKPIGAASDGTLYQHEIGYNAGSSVDAMTSTFKTGYMQLNEADSIVFIDQIWPDFKWQTFDESSPSANMYITFYGTNYAGDTPTQYGPFLMTKNTQYVSPRIRNRLLAIEISTANSNGNSQLNSFFRIGALRYRYQLDGKY